VDNLLDFCFMKYKIFTIHSSFQRFFVGSDCDSRSEERGPFLMNTRNCNLNLDANEKTANEDLGANIKLTAAALNVAINKATG